METTRLAASIRSAYPVSYSLAHEYEATWANLLDEVRRTEQTAAKASRPFWNFGDGERVATGSQYLFDLHDEIAASLLVPSYMATEEYPRWPDMKRGMLDTIAAIGANMEAEDYAGRNKFFGDALTGAIESVEGSADQFVTSTLPAAMDAGQKAATVAGVSLLAIAIGVGALYVLIATRGE